MRKRSEVAPVATSQTDLLPTDCSDCGMPQFQTPSGPTCGNGHGGAEGLPRGSFTTPLPTTEPRGSVPVSVATDIPRGEPVAGATSVTIHWGEEKYGIQGSYSSCSVGPFSLTVQVLPEHDLDAVLKAASATLERFAQAERERKMQTFLEKLARAQGAR